MLTKEQLAALTLASFKTDVAEKLPKPLTSAVIDTVDAVRGASDSILTIADGIGYGEEFMITLALGLEAFVRDILDTVEMDHAVFRKLTDEAFIPKKKD